MEKVQSKTVNQGGLDIEPLLTRPKRVAIVALGHSVKAFIQEVMSNRTMSSPFDEVWTLNRGLRAFAHDKLFVMDDLKWIERRSPGYAKFLKKHDKPIITTTPYPNYPSSIAYPIHDVIETIQDDIFAVNTVSYMLAYAIHIRVKEVSIYGADFIYPDGNKAEEGGQAVAYLCGMMRHFDMIHRMPQDTTLLYANKTRVDQYGRLSRPLYGFHRQEEMAKQDEKEKAMKAARKSAKITSGDK